MKKTIILLQLMLTLSLAGCLGKKQNLTAEKLLEGSPVPVKREFTLSEKVSACEDFHQYTCGKVESEFKLPSDRQRWVFSFSDNAEKLLYAKKNFFKKIDQYTPKTERGSQFKNVYLACMNKDQSAVEEKSYVAEEVKTISEIKNWDGLVTLAQDRLAKGMQSFTGIGPIANKADPMKWDIYLYSDIRALPERSYYHKKDLIKDFKGILVDFFKTVNMSEPEKRAQWVIDFETELADKAPLPKEIRGRFSEKRDITKEELLKKYPNLKLDKILEKVPAKTVLIDIIPETNTFMNEAVAKKDLEQLKSVYAFHSMVGYLDDAYPEFFNKYFKFQHKYLGGPEERPDRQERCTTLAMNQFGMELDYELIDILFPNFPVDRAIAVGEKVRQSIVDGIKTNTWLEPATKEEAIKKIKHAKLHLVKPQRDQDWDFMPIKKYSDKNPYENERLYSATALEKTLAELNNPRNPDRWDMSPLVVNAYYSPSDNKFVLPQGILQYPFFSPELSDTENIAAIGTVVGHELGHGIDDEGSDYDFEGKVRKWFTAKDLENFKKRGERFITQFNKIGHDGKLTLGENIGDHVGLTFSHHAAFADNKAKEKNPEEPKDKIEQQKFFVAYARMWCGVATESEIEKRLKTDPHALGKERINQQVIHIPGFQDAFGCKPGDKMYKAEAERIRVW